VPHRVGGRNVHLPPQRHGGRDGRARHVAAGQTGGFEAICWMKRYARHVATRLSSASLKQMTAHRAVIHIYWMTALWAVIGFVFADDGPVGRHLSR
jgi:hypothetical protein